MGTTSVDPLKVVTGEVRLSFVHLFEPYAQPAQAGQAQQDPKYSCMILVPKTDTKTIRDIERAQKAALEAGKANKFGGSIPKNWKNTFRDADEEQDTEKYPEMAGMMFMTVSSNPDYPPGLVDRRLQPILDRKDLYSGCWARVSLRAFAFNSGNSKGVSFGLNNVMKWRDDEPLGGVVAKAEDDFAGLEDDEDGLI